VESDELVIAGRTFGSRLFLGTGKFPSNAALRGAIAASGTEMVTVALRRVDLTAGAVRKAPAASGSRAARSEAPQSEADSTDILDAIDTDHVLLLTNTSGAVDAEEAIRLARLVRSAGQ
jgi:thiazole synthase